MLYALICIDREDGQTVRQETRPAHLEHIEALGGAVKFAGPFLSEDGSRMTGSLLIVEADTLAAARSIADRDPYAKAGLFASLDIRPWKWTVGNPDAG